MNVMAMKVAGSQTQADLRDNRMSGSSAWSPRCCWPCPSLSRIVGGIALMGVLSIGVIERTKEIGVLRASWRTLPTILGIFVMEGILQGLISWLIAIPISLLVSPLLANALGNAMFGATLDYQYNWSAVGIWLVSFWSSRSWLPSCLPAVRHASACATAWHMHN